MVSVLISIDDNLFKNVLTQLIHSDGMEVTNDYLIKQNIYYIDNVGLIEELERILMKYYYDELKSKGSVDKEELFDRFTPQYINYDKYFVELNNNQTTDKNSIENSLDGYF